MERWKPIDGYEGYYEVSDQGRVRSLDRQVLGPRGDYINLRGRLMTPGAQASGHLNITLSKDNVQKSYRVHRLVLLAFGPPIPGSEYQVMHIDDDPTNNHVKTSDGGHTRTTCGTCALKAGIEDRLEHTVQGGMNYLEVILWPGNSPGATENAGHVTKPGLPVTE